MKQLSFKIYELSQERIIEEIYRLAQSRNWRIILEFTYTPDQVRTGENIACKFLKSLNRELILSELI
jgi:hypothetical protein